MSRPNEQSHLRIYFLVFLIVMLAGTAGFMFVEDLSLADAFYFTIVTVATVGYGDIAPVSFWGKALAVLLIVTGVGTFVGVVANAMEIFLNRREQRALLKKLNMVVGLFFSELGGRLLRFCTEADPGLESYGRELVVQHDWTDRDFARAKTRLAGYPLEIDGARLDLEGLRLYLNQQGGLLVRLLESPYLLEHQAFTDLLVATLHLREELQLRPELANLPERDLDHLRGDLRRVYRHLSSQWLDYVQHLQLHYPFLFSLAMRTNPFDRDASPILR